MRVQSYLLVAELITLVLAGGCASKLPSPQRTGTSVQATGGAAPSAPLQPPASLDPVAGASAPNPTALAPVVMISGNAGGSAPPPDGCVGASATAPPASNPKVDIVWVVDASGSMLDEQIKIGANLTEFANSISQASLDVRIVMMTTSAAIPVICPVTSPDPLNGTPLASDPRYKFIDSRVDSNNLLDVAVNQYPMYGSFLRPDAALHFVFVTDDESNYKVQPTPEMRAQTFQTDMEKLAGKHFTLHTISSDGPEPCRDPNCMPDPETGICVFVMLGCGAARPGATYYALAHNTMGLTASICESDWKKIFLPLTAAVIESAPLPCNYTVPPPPRGETLEPGKVNVRWLAPAAGMEVLWPRAQSMQDCGDSLGWYYDNLGAPKEVLLCPRSCESVANGGTLSLSFGCATVTLN